MNSLVIPSLDDFCRKFRETISSLVHDKGVRNSNPVSTRGRHERLRLFVHLSIHPSVHPSVRPFEWKNQNLWKRVPKRGPTDRPTNQPGRRVVQHATHVLRPSTLGLSSRLQVRIFSICPQSSLGFSFISLFLSGKSTSFFLLHNMARWIWLVQFKRIKLLRTIENYRESQ